MQVKATFIVSNNGKWHTVYELFNGRYFISTNGAFGQRETTIEEIEKDEAVVLINGSMQLPLK